jgi:hypothetical protein
MMQRLMTLGLTFSALVSFACVAASAQTLSPRQQRAVYGPPPSSSRCIAPLYPLCCRRVSGGQHARHRGPIVVDRLVELTPPVA